MLALSQRSRHNLNRFKRQYLQLQADPTYPSSKDLREEAFQQALFEEIFREHATQYQPPDRYQLRVLKELMRRVEASIEDWEEEVCIFADPCCHDGISFRSCYLQTLLV